MTAPIKKLRSVVRGTGSYLPARVMTNAELSTMVETSDEWIQQRSSGIRERHIAAEGETTSMLATKAAEAALVDADATAADIDLIILATSTPDYTFPAVATQIQANLGMHHGAAFDLQAVCSGFVFAVATADKFLTSGSHKRALVIGAETFSRILDWKDRTTCVLFGDGAGAIVLEAQESDDELGARAGSSPRNCAPTAPIGPSSMSMAARPRPRQSAICAWRGKRSSVTPSAWSPT